MWLKRSRTFARTITRVGALARLSPGRFSSAQLSTQRTNQTAINEYHESNAPNSAPAPPRGHHPILSIKHFRNCRKTVGVSLSQSSRRVINQPLFSAVRSRYRGTCRRRSGVAATATMLAPKRETCGLSEPWCGRLWRGCSLRMESCRRLRGLALSSGGRCLRALDGPTVLQRPQTSCPVS